MAALGGTVRARSSRLGGLAIDLELRAAPPDRPAPPDEAPTRDPLDPQVPPDPGRSEPARAPGGGR
jgi:hypothetical protein